MDPIWLLYDGSHIPGLAWAAVLVIVAGGTITDLKTREVPDWLNYAGIILGILFRIFWSVSESSWIYIIEGVAGLFIFYLISLMMYYTGQWGGGDSKMLMAIGALFGIGFDPNSAGVAFFVNLIILGGLYGLAWSTILFLSNSKKVMSQYSMFRDTKAFRYGRVSSWIGFLIFVFIGVYISGGWYSYVAVALAAMILGLFYSMFLVKSIEETVMIKDYPIAKLTEGDWIVEDVFIGKKYICGPKDLGIDLKQIGLLKKQNKIKTVKVKEGMPFIPSFFLAYIATAMAGNLVLFFL